MNKISKILLISLTFILFVSACSNEEDESSTNSNQEKDLVVATGTTTGVYYALGSVLSKIWSDDLGTNVVSQGSNGSVDNINLMKNGDVTLGMSTVNMIYAAYNGEEDFEGNQYEDIRILANLYPNVNHIIASESSGIKTVEEIDGNSFVFGAASSATEIESKLVLEAHGIDINNVEQNYVGFTEAVDLLRNKQVDAVNIYTGVPSSAATELISTVDSKVLSFDEEAIELLTNEDKYPWNFEHVIPSGTYDNQEEDIITIGQFSSLIVDANVSDDTVYELTKAIWENLDDIEQGHAIASQFEPDLAVEGTADVPIHPGAERYYKEIGIIE